MSYQLINIQKDRRNLIIEGLQEEYEAKMLCLAKKKLSNIKLGSNFPSEDDYYDYIELEMLYDMFQKAKCGSSCIQGCIDDIINIIKELLYKIC